MKICDLIGSLETRTPAFWDTPHRSMITHTSDSHQIPSQNKTKSKLQILINCQKFEYWNYARALPVTHFLKKLLDKIYKYEKYPKRTIGTTELTWYAGRMDGRTDGWSETKIPPPPPPPPPPRPPTTSLCGGYNDSIENFHKIWIMSTYTLRTVPS